MEYIDILDENGEKINVIDTKTNVYTKGLWHKAVHIWIINSQNEIMLQKRSPKKKISPNMWTTSVAGNVSASEESYETAVREIFEEIGLLVNKQELQYLFTVKEDKIKNNRIIKEFIDVFLLEKSIDVTKIKLQEDEVSEIKFISYQEFKNMVLNNNSTLSEHKEMHAKLLDILEKI